MRRFLALAGSATLEALAEPLSAVLFLVALATVHVAPVFHYHQFGEAGRLARECGFSALLVFGLVFATAAAVRAVGGEIASGTAAVALARPVPRPLFFCAKVAGVGTAFALFMVAVASATVLATYSSAVGADAAYEGESMRIWQPGLVLGVGLTFCAFVGAALLNRFARARFCFSACVLTAGVQPLALLAAMPFGRGGIAATAGAMPWAIVPALALLACGCFVFISFAGALSVCLKPAPVAALVAAATLLSFIWPVRAILPEISRFWLVDRLAEGGAMPWGEALTAAGASVCLAAFWLLAGSMMLNRRELP